MKLVLLVIYFLGTQMAFGLECNEQEPLKVYTPKYARYFKINFYKNFKILKTSKPYEREYLLSNKIKDIECHTNYKVITPVKSIAMTSTTYIASLDLLEEAKSLIAFQGVKYIYSEKINTEKLVNLNFDLSLEQLIKIKPQLVMGYYENISNGNKESKLNLLKIPFVFNLDQLEESPLARSEWIVFISSFFDKEKVGKNIFNSIEKNYKEILNQSSQKLKKVLVGDYQNGKWVMPGGKSDFAQLLRDAGAEMYFAKSSKSTQYIPFEEVRKELATKKEVIWLTNNSWISKSEIETGSRYSFINAKYIYNYTNKISKSGANDFWEMGLQRPDLLLLDLQNIILNKTEKLVWYKKL